MSIDSNDKEFPIQYNIKTIEYNYKCGCQFVKIEKRHPITKQYLEALDDMRLITLCDSHQSGGKKNPYICMYSDCLQEKIENKQYCLEHLLQVIDEIKGIT